MVGNYRNRVNSCARLVWAVWGKGRRERTGCSMELWSCLLRAVGAPPTEGASCVGMSLGTTGVTWRIGASHGCPALRGQLTRMLLSSPGAAWVPRTQVTQALCSWRGFTAESFRREVKSSALLTCPAMLPLPSTQQASHHVGGQGESQ